jgi:spoIIIJ-associated protein
MAERTFDPDELAARIEPLLKDILRLAGFNLTFEIQRASAALDREFENPDLIVNFDGADADLLLQNKGELLTALEHTVLEAAGVGERRERVLFDCHDYRMMRVEELQLAAEAAADRVRRTGVAHRFNPMTSRERRVIHMALRGEAGVRTESEGLGPQRRVVIHSAQASAGPQASKPHAPSR